MSKLVKSYNQLPSNVKQSINNMAVKAATAAVKQVQNQVTSSKQSRARARTNRTRNGMRVYTPTDIVENKAIAPVSYATTWTSGNKSLRVHQTEVICKLKANKTLFPYFHEKYSVAAFPINPASPRTFPWLSYIARLYDKYRFHSLRFIYVNSVSTQTEGNLMMSLDYDTLDAAPKSLVEASQLAKFKLCPLYCPADFPIPVSHPGNAPWLYTFDLIASKNGNVDLKTYNLGNLFISLDGVPQNDKDYGYIAVEYDVELLDKNPVIDVFASKTWDLSAIFPTKKARSNVDPADTMTVTIDAKRTYQEREWNGQTRYNPTDSVTFTCDAPVGSRIRCVFSVKAWDPIWDNPVVSAGTILDYDEMDAMMSEMHQGAPCLGVFSVDGTVADDGTFFSFSRRSGGDSDSPEPGYEPVVKVSAAYTYA
jgi:hypothetical protein